MNRYGLALLATLGCGGRPALDDGLRSEDSDARVCQGQSGCDSRLAYKETTECLAEGMDCYNHEQSCCGGFFCELDQGAYGIALCAPLLDNGSLCTDDTQCLSGHCVASTCAADDCLPEGTDCYDSDVVCCEGLFCSSELGSYGVAFCVEPLPNGEFCLEDKQCASSHCVHNICREDGCLPKGIDCYDAKVTCCDGLFCSVDLNSYGIARCLPPLEDGEFCTEDAQCMSGTCLDSLCGTDDCLLEGESCLDGGTCCTGFFCYEGHYALGLCEPAHGPGEYCQADDWCLAGLCVDGGCASP